MEQAVPHNALYVSEAEYLRRESHAKTRHAYRNGMILDMAGGTSAHAGIAMTFGAALVQRLRGSPCRVFGSDLAVRIKESGNYLYPDLSVVCGEIEYAFEDRKTIITNPKLLVEVTSADSAADDRGDKFSDYRRINTFEEYVLISQTRAQVETFYRQSDSVWAIGPAVTESKGSVHLRSLGIEIPLIEIHDGIEFSSEPPKASSELR